MRTSCKYHLLGSSLFLTSFSTASVIPTLLSRYKTDQQESIASGRLRTVGEVFEKHVPQQRRQQQDAHGSDRDVPQSQLDPHRTHERSFFSSYVHPRDSIRV